MRRNYPNPMLTDERVDVGAAADQTFLIVRAPEDLIDQEKEGDGRFQL